MTNQFQLFKQRFFSSYFTVQALGAFNDNVFKNAIIMLITFQVATDSVNTLNNLAAGLLIVPYVLFSSLAGQVAEKYEKSTLIRRIKLAEVIIMTVGAIGFLLGDVSMLLFVLFFMGLQSTFFGPIKYSILPQQLKSEAILSATSLVEMGTFVAIISGMVMGGFLMGFIDGRTFVALAVIVFSVIGFLASQRIPATPAVTPDLTIDWNLWRESRATMRFIRTTPSLWHLIFANAWFWFIGAAVLPQIPNFVKTVLNGSEHAATFVIAAFSIGVALGSLLCSLLSGKRIEMGLIPLGCIGMSVFLFDLYLAAPASLDHTGVPSGVWGFLGTVSGLRVMFDCLMLGVFGGLYIVPLYALLQTRCEPHHLSRVVAGNNILGSSMMLGSAVLSIVMLALLGLSIAQFFLFLSVINAAMFFKIYTTIPAHFLRFCAWCVTHVLYRVRKSGVDNIPETGGCIVVCNHVSFVDAIVLSGAIRRPMRFVIWHAFCDKPILKPVLRGMNVIPIATREENPQTLRRGLQEVNAALAAGDVVCIFPEGSITRDGEIGAFQSGIEFLLKRHPAPVVPVALQGLWLSLFSRNPKRFAKRVSRLRTIVGVCVGEVVPAERATCEYLLAQVKTLRGELR